MDGNRTLITLQPQRYMCIVQAIPDTRPFHVSGHPLDPSAWLQSVERCLHYSDPERRPICRRPVYNVVQLFIPIAIMAVAPVLQVQSARASLAPPQPSASPVSGSSDIPSLGASWNMLPICPDKVLALVPIIEALPPRILRNIPNSMRSCFQTLSPQHRIPFPLCLSPRCCL